MTNVTNNMPATVCIGGVTIAPGDTAAVPNWDQVSKTGAVPAWLARDLVSTRKRRKVKTAKAEIADSDAAPHVASDTPEDG